MTGPGAAEELPAGQAVTLLAPRIERAVQGDARPLDLAAAPGVELSGQRAWRAGHAQLQAACVAAPASSWLPGLEGPVLAGASALARKHLGASSLRAGQVQAQGSVLSQPFEAGQGEAWSGRHLLAFSHDEVLLCTLACNDGGEGGLCEPWLAAARLDGPLTAPPAPGWLARAAGGAAAHPGLAGSTLAAVVLLAVAVLLWRRPKPRW